MEPRLSFVTLGVDDVARSRKFYEALGFKASAASQPEVTFFDAGGVVLSIFGREALAKDALQPASKPGFSGVALAHNVGSEAEVDQVLGEAVAAGAKLLKAGEKAFWGGYSGYFADPDGHLWEVAYNPFMPLDADGRVTLPGSLSMTIDGLSDDEVRAILERVKTFAVVGASAKPERPSYGVMRFFIEKGYSVRPVNPGIAGQKIQGNEVYADLASVPAPADVIDVFRTPAAALQVVRDAIAVKARLGASVVWMQLGVINEEAAAEARAAGFTVVMDRCPKIEFARLMRG